MKMYAVADIDSGVVYALYADETEAWIVCDDFGDEGNKWVYEAEVAFTITGDAAEIFNRTAAIKMKTLADVNAAVREP